MLINIIVRVKCEQIKFDGVVAVFENCVGSVWIRVTHSTQA